MRCYFSRVILFLFLSVLLQTTSFAQFVTGQMIRACTNATGKNILDPDNATDGSSTIDYTSKTSTGFGTATSRPDIMESEIPYKPLPPFALEPNSDLRRGADHLFSDYVPDINGAAYYMHYNSTSNSFLFRTRVGTIVPGAKGYSLLFDTDGKWGAAGANADPNFVAATTGTGGNPGFEIEIVLCTGGVNNGIQVYNVDGRDTPGTPVGSYTTWTDYSQISIAATNDNGNPDFLLDFYVPTSVFTNAPFNLNLATSTLRVIPTTVMSGQAAIGGPKSDIYGLNDDLYPNTNVEYETLLGAQPGLPITSWGGTGTTTPVTQCTAPPVITTSTIAIGNVTINGTWTKSTLTGTEKSTANIKVYKKAAATGTITLEQTVTGINSGGTWTTASTIAVAANDIIYVKAVATGESECLSSNTLQAPAACNSTNTPVKPVLLTCADPTRGFSGNNYPSGTTIFFEGLSTTADNNNSVTNTSSLFAITGVNWTFKGGCGGGSPLSKDVYKVYYKNTTSGCNSDPVYLCVTGSSSPLTTGTAPTIISKLTPGATQISGTATTGATVALSINGFQVATTTATSGSYSFANLALVNNDAIIVTSFNPATTCPASSSDVVKCFSRTPSINTNTSGTLTINQPISGTSSDAVGTVIRLYNSANSLLATTTVKTGGVWSTANSPETTPAVYNAAANTTYYVTGQLGSCSVSTPTGNLTTFSGTTTGRCAAATITTNPLNSGTTTLGGDFGSSTATAKVYIYEDGFLLDSSAALISATSWTKSGLTLYAGNGTSTGKITIGIRETNKEMETCTNTYYVVPVNCTTPTAGSITITPASNQTIPVGQSVTFGFSSAATGVFYSIINASTGDDMGSLLASTSSFNITTRPFTQTTNAIVMGASLTTIGESCSATLASRTVSVVTLPIHLFEFKGVHKEDQNILTWITALEEDASHFEVERSTDGVNYTTIGRVALHGTNHPYIYIDKQLQAPINYYRLEMIDRDGKFSYSRIVSLRGNGAAVTATVWPNPFTGELNIEALLVEAGNITVKLLNEHGSQMLSKQVSGHKGVNLIKFPIYKSLAAGIYVLQVHTVSGITQQKLIRVSN